MENYGWKAIGNIDVTKLTPKARKEVGEYRRMILASAPSFLNIQKLDLKSLKEVHRSIEVCTNHRAMQDIRSRM